MKYVKMLGLAAVTAAALMALGGAGTASAGVICSTTISPCPPGQAWPNTPNGIDFSSENSSGTGAGKLLVETTGGIIRNECESTIQGTLKNGSATTKPTLSGISWSWTNCTFTTDNIKIGTLEFDNITGSSNGTVTVDTSFEWTTIISTLEGNKSCLYVFPVGLDLGTINEGNPPTMSINVVVNTALGQDPNCPTDTRWTANYKLTTPASTTGSLSTS